ncbi:MAG: ABC transporter ATP-binding protein [Acidiferrobacterales bacterium]
MFKLKQNDGDTSAGYRFRSDNEKGMRRENIVKGDLEIRGLHINFNEGKESRAAVAGIDLEVPRGQFLCILGPSGCGKSTLLNAVAGHIRPAGGTIALDRELVVKPGPDRGMVFQQYSLFPWKTVKQNVEFGPRMAGNGPVLSESVARTFLGLAGLADFADRYPATLSGGMQQRVGIARALANYPSVLLMDEPFGALDAQTKIIMQESLLRIWEEFKTTVLFVTHDIDEAIFLADRIVVMTSAPGKIAADLKVNISRPRHHDVVVNQEFIELKRTCLSLIKKETMKGFSSS